MSQPSDGHPHVFPATQWSLVERARQPDEAERHKALATLLQRYLPALRAHLVFEKQIAPDRADDLLQGFVADKIIEQRLLDHAQEGRGKFRSFLLATLNHYVISQHRMDTAAKRSPTAGIETLGDASDRVPGGDDPSDQFNVVWAQELIAEAIRRMKEECEQSERNDVWTIFDGRVLRPAFDTVPPVDYEKLVEQLRLKAPLDACRLLTTAKRMFERNLRSVAAEYAGDKGDTDVELNDLKNSLARATRRG
jgi:DNA-directed RNA polymerase specialized sigma24 family protein